MAEIRINATGGVKLYDADDSHYAQIIAGTITANVDLLTLNSAGITVLDGAIDFDIASHDTSNGLKLGGTLVTATAAELNIMDGVGATASEINLIDGSAKSTSSITIADADAFVIIDGTTTKQIPASDIKTYAGTTINNATANELVTIGSTTTELDAESGLTYTDGALVIGGTTPSLTIGDAGAEDTKIVFDGNAQDWHIGLDDSADDLVIGLGSTLGTTSHIVIDEAGCVTKPLQPAFHVQHGNLANVTGDGTTYVIVMSTENFDVNGDWSSATFTAPVTGKYFFSMTVHFESITGDKRTLLEIGASNRVLPRYFQSDPESNNVDGAHLSGLVDMDASDTVQFKVTVEGVGADSVDLTDYSHYQGFLVC
jgi:hypothetical protein